MEQPDIKGYRKLNEEEAFLMNLIKASAESLGALVDRLDKLPNPKPESQDPVQIDKRWLSIARTQLQQGFMALTRSVARPTSF